MLKEQAVEAKVVAALSAAFGSQSLAPAIAGYYQPTAAGELKGYESGASAALLEVFTGTAGQENFSSVVITIPVTIALTLRLERDPTGVGLVAYVEPIRDLFQTWISSCYQSPFTALDTDDISIDSVSVLASTPTVDAQKMTARVAWNLTLAGSYKPTTTSTI